MVEPVGVEARFEIAGGRVIGAEHRRIDRPCQDAFSWLSAESLLVATVCDGCGSGRHSEVGATLGAHLWTHALASHLRGKPIEPEAWSEAWRRAQREVCTTLARLAEAMTRSSDPARIADVVAEHFLFTVVGAAITPEATAIFAIGDGVVAVNGTAEVIGPFRNNQPPYLAYAIGEDSRDIPPSFQRIEPTANIVSIVLASDGACDISGDGDRDRDGDSDGNASDALGQFLADRYFRNRDAIRRRLAVLNREACEVDWERGRLRRSRGALPDDTTVVAIRRRPGAEL